jgi:nucleoside-diphosphate-sugar epimerase
MRVFVVGASGAIGSRLVPQLVERGHDLIGTSRSAEKAERLGGLGAKSVVLDVFDAGALREAVAAAQPDAIVYQATALDGLSDFNNFDRSFAETNRLRTEGTDNVLAAARAARVPRVVAQSAAAHRYAREGGAVKNEDDLLDPTPPPEMRETLEALAYLDEAVTGAGGVALRYGVFYGNPVDPVGNAVSAGQWPIVGNGGGVWSFIHLEDAAAATVLALEHDGPAIYNVVDDEPVTAAVWLAELAKILDATPPQRVSSEQARDFAGETSVVISTESRGASNTKAKRELGWTLRYPTWRQGFAAVYAGREPLRGAA